MRKYVTRPVFLTLFSLSLVLLTLSMRSFADDVESLAEEGWLEVQTPNFRILSDASERHATSFAVDMEYFSRILPMFTNSKLKPGISKLTVFALKDSSNLKILLNSPNSAGVFYSSGGQNYAIANLRDYSFNRNKQNYARQILFHEYVHFFTRNAQSTFRYPMWYSEGLADFFSTVIISKKKIKYGMAHEGRMRGINPRKSIPVKKLFETDEYPEGRREKGDFYEYAWLVFHFLFNHPDYKVKNLEFLALFNQNIPEEEAFEEAFQMSYEEFGKELKSYLGSKYTYHVLNLEIALEPNIEEPKDISPSNIAYELGKLILARTLEEDVSKEEHKKLGYELMEYALVHQPGNISAQVVLLERSMWSASKQEDVKTFDAVGTVIEDLYDAHPKHTAVAKALGDWMMLQASWALANQDFDDAMLNATNARGKFRRAISIDPENLSAFLSLAKLYRKYGQHLLTSSKEYEEYETVLIELRYFLNDPHYSYNLAIIFEQQEKFDQAIKEYQSLASGRSARLKKLAKARLAVLSS